jgi:DNA segregation ATPase FtsK/SpoIIIE, S-DNA-T family
LPPRIWLVIGAALFFGAVTGSDRVVVATLLLGAMAPLLEHGTWRGVRAVAERVRGRAGDLFGLVWAWRTWAELGPHLGLATVDPRTARQILPTLGGSGGLVLNPGEAEWIVPRLTFRPTGWGFTATGRLVAGMVPDDFTAKTDALVHAWYAHLIRISSPERGWVRLTVLRRDPLAAPVRPAPIPPVPDLMALPIGRREDGRAWTVRLLGRHILIAGSTGAGKGSVQWSLLRALGPLLVSGVVQVWTADPKRMEFPSGLALFARYAADPAGIVDLIEDAARVLDARAARLAGHTRQHLPSAGDPLLVLNLDEIAFLTAYLPDRKLRERFGAALARILTQGRAVGVLVVAALQDPRKEVLTLRGLFPTRIALRLDDESQVDMVLGDGALERGAACHLISADEHTGAGAAYVVDEGDPTPVRVRAGHVTDADIAELVRDYPAVPASGPAGGAAA